MIELFGFSPAYGMPDASPFVVKVAVYLRMIGLEYELRSGDARKAPKRKLPFIDDKGQRIADSSHIVEYLRKTYKDLDAGMSVRDRAIATAYKSMLEEHYYFVILTLRWVDDRGFVVLKPMLIDTVKKAGVPGLLAPALVTVIRKQAQKTAYAQGTSRHSIAEVEQLGMNHIDSLAEWLGDRPYFLGDEPRSLDATVFAFVWATLDSPFENRVKAHMQSKANLVAYRDRMKERYFKNG